MIPLYSSAARNRSSFSTPLLFMHVCCAGVFFAKGGWPAWGIFALMYILHVFALTAGFHRVITSYSIHYTKLYDHVLQVVPYANAAVNAPHFRRIHDEFKAARIPAVREGEVPPAYRIVGKGHVKKRRYLELKADVLGPRDARHLLEVYPENAERRITSYNVCYTKLLRYRLFLT